MPEPYTPEMRAEDAETIRIMGEDYDLLDNPKARDDFYRIAAQHTCMVPYELATQIAGAITDDEHTAATMELLKWKPTP